MGTLRQASGKQFMAFLVGKYLHEQNTNDISLEKGFPIILAMVASVHGDSELRWTGWSDGRL
jgi:hypothetical protein